MNANIPLNLRLKKKSEKNIAYAQDIIVEELYNHFPNAVIHGGTAIWSCYQGNRFSEDVDVYIPKDAKKIEQFLKSLESRGFGILKKRIKENSVYSALALNNTETKFEATFQAKKPILKKYETSESFYINVYTLTPEEIVIEKIETYLKRFKIRDLYDIYFLKSHVRDEDKIIKHIKKLIVNYKKPVDEDNLASIILAGVIPSSDELLKEIKRWVK